MPLPDDSSKKARIPPLADKTQTIPPTPSSYSLSKEKEIGLSEEKVLEEVRAGIEMEIAKEVKEAGVKEIKETIEIPQKVVRETGITEVGEGVPVSITPTLKLPLDDQKIKQTIKKNKIIDSILWLAHWCLRQIKIAKLKALKLVGIKKTQNLSA